MDCTKCQGLMVKEALSDGFVRMNVWRCVNCGSLIDAVIGENRVRHDRRQRGSSDTQSFVVARMRMPAPHDSARIDDGSDGGSADSISFMKTISLLKMVGTCCSTPADGRTVNELIQSLLNEGNTVELDFHGVRLVTSSFYRAAVGDLICSFPKEFVESHLSLSGLSDGLTQGLEFLTAGVPRTMSDGS